jgi:hypothetical protein
MLSGAFPVAPALLAVDTWTPHVVKLVGRAADPSVAVLRSQVGVRPHPAYVSLSAVGTRLRALSPQLALAAAVSRLGCLGVPPPCMLRCRRRRVCAVRARACVVVLVQLFDIDCGMLQVLLEPKTRRGHDGRHHDCDHAA